MAQINKPSDYFNTVLYTGNATARSITGVGFQPDWVWIKKRSEIGNHRLVDSIRGATKELLSDATDAEATTTGQVTSFDSDGFSLGTSNSTNKNLITFASWNWKAGTTSGLSGGTITPTAYSINTTSGFGIYKYTGNSTAGANIAHGLGKIPKMIIVKRTDSTPNWQIYHQAMGNGKWLEFTTGAAQTATNRWNDTSPTNTLFYLGTDSDVNSSSGTYIAYVFCDVPGYSKFGSYVGNGNADGTFVYTGFKPAFVIQKVTNTTAQWNMHDSARDPFNQVNRLLYPSNSNAEENNISDQMDFFSNGFKFRNTGAASNGSGNSYIYMAFASEPLVGTNNTPATAR